MHVVVATEARLFRGDDGVIRSVSDGRAYGFWTRYLAAFDGVCVLARVADTDGREGRPVEGPGVSVLPVTDFVGLSQLALRQGAVRRDVRRAVGLAPDTAYIARVPGMLGELLTSVLRGKGHPFALEIVGDPSAALSAVIGRTPQGVLVSRLGAWQLRRQCRGAAAAAYVTRDVLQRKYPPGTGTRVFTFSSVELPEEAFRDEVRVEFCSRPMLVAVGTLNQMYKGHDVLIEALAVLIDRGIDAEVTIVGDGRFREDLVSLAADRHVDQWVHFTGTLESPEEVRLALDRADVFVMPSRTEGLPRALLEAMARGRPCVGTRVGGIPEVLDEEDLVPPDEPGRLADSLADVLRDRERRARMARRNLRVAKQYHRDLLTKEREEFYRTVRELSHIEGGSSPGRQENS